MFRLMVTRFESALMRVPSEEEEVSSTTTTTSISTSHNNEPCEETAICQRMGVMAAFSSFLEFQTYVLLLWSIMLLTKTYILDLALHHKWLVYVVLD